MIEVLTEVAAPPELVFDLSRSIDIHMESTAKTNERAVAGRTSGLIELGEEVTWEATHFGVRQRLTAKITQFDRPHHFRDVMVRGAFKRFDHDHIFQPQDTGTLMRDVFDYTSPLGWLGKIADKLFLTRYMRGFLLERNNVIKHIAESGDAEKFLGQNSD